MIPQRSKGFKVNEIRTKLISEQGGKATKDRHDWLFSHDRIVALQQECEMLARGRNRWADRAAALDQEVQAIRKSWWYRLGQWLRVI